jgi:signal transduction histidine kinase/HPt (histidine-containing phosphotransfer) domain-containing protein
MADHGLTLQKLAKLKRVFRSSLRERSTELQTHYERLILQPNAESIRNLRAPAHRLAGAGATFGFPQISTIAAQLEGLLDAQLDMMLNPADEIQELGFGEIRGLYERLQNALIMALEGEESHDLKQQDVDSDELKTTAQSWHVWIVSSQKQLLQDCCEALQSPGLHLHTCADLGSLTEALKSLPAHLVIVDAADGHQPDHQALRATEVSEAIQSLKANRPSCEAIVLVNGADYATASLLSAAGVSLILPHPVDSTLVRAALADSVLLPENHPLRILILDDDHILLEYYRLQLTASGTLVTCLSEPSNLMAVMTDFQPELLVIDVHLRSCSGLDVARVVRADARFQTIPIVFMSTDGTLRQRQEARSFAADDYLTKPLSAKDLLQSATPRARLYRKQTELHQSLQRTIREKEEAQARAVAARNSMAQFLTTMTHEIRTPLNGVLGMAQLLSKTALNTEQLEYTSLLKTAGDHLSALIDSFLDYSKLEVGKLSLNEAPARLSDVITTAGQLVAPQAQKKGVTLLLAWDQKCTDKFYADSLRLTQVFSNLLSNAVRFSERGIVVITAETCSHSSGHSNVSFTISDTGVGMDSEQLRNLFQPFLQVHQTDGKLYGGTGLGLSIARHIVRLMGSDIEVSSAKGVGSDFKFEVSLRHVPVTDASEWDQDNPLTRIQNRRPSQKFVPVRGDTIRRTELLKRFLRTAQNNSISSTKSKRKLQAHEVTVSIARGPGDETGADLVLTSGMSPITPICLTQFHDRAAPAPEERQGDTPHVLRTLDHLRILVAEDQPINQIYITRVLEQLGAAVTLVEDGNEAVHAVQASEFDLILMDCHMPVLSGYDAARAIRRMGCKVPILAATANAHWDERSRCEAAGMDGILTKPISEERLVSCIWEQFPRLDTLIERAGPQDSDFKKWPLINADQVAALQATPMGESTLFHAMMEKWPTVVSSFTDGVNQAISNGDHAQLRDHAHRMKGAAGNLGAERLYRYCTFLQAISATGTAHDCQRAALTAPQILRDTGDALAALAMRCDRIS